MSGGNLSNIDVLNAQSATLGNLAGSGTRAVSCNPSGQLIPGSSGGSGSLCMPGTIAVPPTIAGGGWSGFNNGGTATTAADVTLGSSTGIFFNVAATATNGNGYVRAGSNSATMSVEVATGMTNDAALGPTSIQALFSGAMMVEIATSKWVQIVVESASVADSEQADYTGLLFRGSNISAVQSVKNFSAWSQPFVRLILSGLNLLGQVSVDRVNWKTVYSIPILTAFTAPPSIGNPYNVGIGFVAANDGGVTGVTLFNFDAT